MFANKLSGFQQQRQAMQSQSLMPAKSDRVASMLAASSRNAAAAQDWFAPRQPTADEIAAENLKWETQGSAMQQAGVPAGVDVSGFGKNVPLSLIATESSGRWDAQNAEAGAGGAKGHYGLLQFGHARLADARKAGVVPQDMTPEQFMQDRNTQVAAINWHFDDIDRRIVSNNLNRFVGQTIGGVPITMNGMRAMAHLGGFGGLSRFLNSNGSYNPGDSFKTTLSAYGLKHQ